jgi:5,10-methylenetetrahydromethanopterin reductase
MPVPISVALPPTRHIVDYAKAVQNAGAHRLWLYDSPAVYSDIWIALARAAEATSLPLGTAVAVPSLRHPMVTAAAIASIEELAPGHRCDLRPADHPYGYAAFTVNQSPAT